MFINLPRKKYTLANKEIVYHINWCKQHNWTPEHAKWLTGNMDQITSQVEWELKLLVLTGIWQDFETTPCRFLQHTRTVTNINIIQQSYSVTFPTIYYVFLILFKHTTSRLTSSLLISLLWQYGAYRTHTKFLIMWFSPFTQWSLLYQCSLVLNTAAHKRIYVSRHKNDFLCNLYATGLIFTNSVHSVKE
jgi:hypothetical protein